MMNDRVSISHEDILNKEFKIEVRGYRMKEVDSYLDEIIKEIIYHENFEKRLENENAILIRENRQLKEELRKMKSNLELIGSNNVNRSNITNIDLLKRIGELEKVVFGNRE